MTSADILSRIILYLPFKRKVLFKSYKRFHMDIRNEAKIADMVQPSPIGAVYSQAIKTFEGTNKNDFPKNFTKLKYLMNNLKAEDLGLNETLTNPNNWSSPKKAPCTYIEIFQNNLVNMSVFILKPGFKMPLHDHPEMHGLLKVVSGSVKMRSFSEYPLKELVNKVDFATRVKLEAQRLANGFHKNRKLFAEVTTISVCQGNSDPCVLTPTNSNFHEIQALDMGAAFFDILSPPYDTFIEGLKSRTCSYYRVSNEISTNVVELEQIEAPDCFYCDQVSYTGPFFT